MNEDEKQAKSAPKLKGKRSFTRDPNAQARFRAGQRSANAKSGKPLDEGVSEDAKPLEVEDESAAGEGGIVAEAVKEAEAVEGAPEGESPAEEAKEPAAEETTETPAEEAAEPAAEETPAEEAKEPAAEEAAETPAEEAAEPAAEEAPAEEAAQVPAEEAAEPAAEEAASNEYAPPEGPSHDELINQYHEALAYGDIEMANKLYRELQNHRFMENVHRTKTEAQAKKDEDEYEATARELATQHPELGEDGLPADKVMALADLYRREGQSAAQALRSAVADLYPEQPPTPTEAAPMAAAAEETPTAPAPAEEVPEPEAPAAEAAPGGAEAEGGIIPDMTARKANKANLSVVPTATARNTPPPPPPAPTRSSAISEMKRARGQA